MKHKNYRIIQKKDKFYIQEEYKFFFIKWWDLIYYNNFSSEFYTKAKAIEELDKLIKYNSLPEFKVIKIR